MSLVLKYLKISVLLVISLILGLIPYLFFSVVTLDILQVIGFRGPNEPIGPASVAYVYYGLSVLLVYLFIKYEWDKLPPS